MITTATQNHQPTTVRRPALFMSPPSANTGNSRLLSPLSISPTPQRLSQANGNETAEVRLAILGALGVGKSALVVKYITRRFIVEYDPLLEDVYTKTEMFTSRTVNVKIMDTSDSPDKKPERYLKWAHGFIVVYSIVCRSSFDQAAVYLDTVSKYQRLCGGNEGPLALVGNKADLERYRTVGRSEAEALASRFDCIYLETSAAEDLDSVTDAFGRLLADIMRQRSRQPSLQSLFITEDRHGKTSTASKTTSSTVGDVTPKDTVDKKDDMKLQATVSTPRRSTAGFKLFNKGFRIFN